MDRGAWWAIVHSVAESGMTEATQHAPTPSTASVAILQADWVGKHLKRESARLHAVEMNAEPNLLPG